MEHLLIISRCIGIELYAQFAAEVRRHTEAHDECAKAKMKIKTFGYREVRQLPPKGELSSTFQHAGVLHLRTLV